MKSWPITKLGEVLLHRKEFITIDDLTNYKRPRVQLHVQGIVFRDEVPGALIKTKTQQVCRAGEFLVAEIDAKVGGFGIVPKSLDGSIVSSHYFLFVIDESKLDRRFLDSFIRTPAFREQVAAQGSTNYAAIRPAHVLGYEHGFVNQAFDILQVLGGHEPTVPIPDFQDAYQTQRVLEAGVISAAERRPVPLEEVR